MLPPPSLPATEPTAEACKLFDMPPATRYHSHTALAEPEDDPGFAESTSTEPIEEVEDDDGGLTEQFSLQ